MKTFQEPRSPRRLAQLPRWETGLLIGFLAIGLIGIFNHAMWRDELNGWLIAKYSQNWGEFWGNIRYEGHPILWYLCLYGLNQLTANPVAMQLFHLALATAAMALWLYFSPFTRLQKVLFVLGYLPIYEYLVISRNYAIGLLTLFAICVLFPTRQKSYLPLAIALAILANTNAYGLLIAIALGLTLILEYLCRKALNLSLSSSPANRILSIIIVLAGIALSVIMLMPPGDANLQGGANQWFFQWDFHRFNQALSRIWNSYILILVPGDSKPLDVLIFSVLSLGLLGFCMTLFWEFPLVLSFYLLGSSSILLFTYLKFLGSARHYGHLYLILMTAFWLKSYYQPSPLLSQLSPFKVWGDHQRHLLSQWQTWVKRHQKTFFMVLLICQMIAGLIGLIRDLTLPYSASRETAHYLKVNHLDQEFLMGSEDFAMTPISGYLGQKIYYPESQTMGSFVLFNSQRKPVNDDEILQLAQKQLQQQNLSQLILILNHPLDQKAQEKQSSLNVKAIAAMTRSFIGNEQYYLYRVIPPSPS